MGNRSSGHSHGVHSDDIFDLHWTASRQKLLKSFLPGYFVDDLPTEEEIDLVKNYWNRIRGGVSDEDCGPEVEDLSLMPEFLAEFHNRLNEICPAFRSKKLSYNFISTLLNRVFDNMEEVAFASFLDTFARKMSEKGVLVCEYGPIGDALFYSLSQVLGPAYTVRIHQNVIRFYCLLLSYILPTAVILDLQTNQINQSFCTRMDEMDCRIVPIVLMKPNSPSSLSSSSTLKRTTLGPKRFLSRSMPDMSAATLKLW